MAIYAQIDSNNIVISVSQLSGEVTADQMIAIQSYDESLLGCIYQNGTFSQPTPTIDELKSSKFAELQSARDSAIYTQFASKALDGNTNKTYTYDQEAAENFKEESIKLLIDTTITTVSWATVEDGFIDHTRDQFLQVVKDAGTFVDGLKRKYFTLKAQVDAITESTTDYESAIAAIVW